VRASRYTLEVPVEAGIVLVNLLSRSVLELDVDGLATYRSFLRPDARRPRSGDRRAFHDALRAGLFLIDEDFDEMAFLQARVHRDRSDSDELALVIAPTMGCNFDCHYCFQDHAGSAMTADAERQLLDYVAKRLDGKKRIAVQWFGGEPLKQLDQIERVSRSLIALAEVRGIEYGAAIVTNGFFLTEETAQRLRACRVTAAQITLEGVKTLHDRTRIADKGTSSYETILGNVRSSGHLLDINVRIHVAPFNVEGVKTLLEDLAARGMRRCIKSIYFAPLFDYKPRDGRVQFRADAKRFYNAESFAHIEVALFEELARLDLPMPDVLYGPFSVCTAVREHALVVGPSGRFYKCYFELDKPHRAFGDVGSGITDAAREADWLDHEIARDEECRRCPVLPICFGGCTHKWQEGAPKEVICTRLRYNAPQLLSIAFGRRGDGNSSKTDASDVPALEGGPAMGVTGGAAAAEN
jgi:uncharacterized protein